MSLTADLQSAHVKSLCSAKSKGKKGHEHLFVLVLCSLQRATFRGFYLCLVIKRRKFVGFVSLQDQGIPSFTLELLSFFLFFRKVILKLSNKQLLPGVAK